MAEQSLVPVDHGSTYGGNPLACMAVRTVMDIYEREDIPGHVRRVTPELTEALDRIARQYPQIRLRRGVGLMQGLALEPSLPSGKVVSAAFERGLLLLTAEGNVVRFLPPLIITRDDIEKMEEILSLKKWRKFYLPLYNRSTIC